MSNRAKVLPFPHFDRPTVRVTLWEGPGRPHEDALRAELAGAGYQVVRWSNEPATGYPPHAHIYPELLVVVAGDLTLVLPAEERLLALGPGDRAQVPQGVLHGTMAGPEGVTYLLATK
ncbi:MAG: hypothetical protein BWY52_02287 [Chloroflexi bacterium ADurb.Bin325]|nr:MAG: hypothetical protein BWY52_02287 [Chloroflexi bacterium ADurb.Bin325]